MNIRMTTILMLLTSQAYAGDDGEAYRQALDSTVYIRAIDKKWNITTGSGVLVKPGVIVTAFHVVREDTLVMAFFPHRAADGSVDNSADSTLKRGCTPCFVVAFDQKRDLALLSIIGDDTHKPLPMAAKSAEPGVSLFTIGSSPPVLWRYAGGNARAVYDDAYEFPGQKIACKVLEMSCPINPGDSGGPIIANGELVGISSCSVKDKNLIQKGIDITEIHAFLKAAKQ